jgi:putative transcriptional regulator
MNKIKILRDNFNLSQFEVAQKMGISRTTYISIENGKREMTLPEIEKLAKILGIRTQDLASTEVSTEKNQL